MTADQHRRLIRFLTEDPAGFTSALVNTADTYQEEGLYRKPQWESEPWLLDFLLAHDENATSTVA